MIVVLVRWYIIEGKEDEFLEYWESLKVDDNKGLYRETLTQEDSEMNKPQFRTFNLEGKSYVTFINVGMWESLLHFENAIEKPYMPSRIEIEGEKYKGKEYIEIKKFEYKLRERIVLKEVSSRGQDLPPAKSKN
jgi:hypothetical protein